MGELLDERGLVAAAQAGDARAFESLVTPHRRMVLAHCYRLLGSSADADDAVQEAMLRAWKYLAGFEGRSSARSWLYAIATKVCLDALAHRGPRTLSGFDQTEPSRGDGMPANPLPESHWVEPLADARWVDGSLDVRESPESQCTLRQSVALAFLATIQLLPPSQRAALLLREVAGWSAHEIALALEQTEAAVNSSLQRARKTLDERIPQWNRSISSTPTDTTARDETLSRYLRAWQSPDPSLLSSVLCEDVITTMPPMPMWFADRDAMLRFFTGFVLQLPTRFRASAVISVNGAPAVGVYAMRPDGVFVADSVHVLSLDAQSQVTLLAVFRGEKAVLSCGLPATLA
ncbi:MAG: RNA polymerase subunit sigma-70 [Deltaproteobacteria bacterium]|nr:RNA polymerase subunit sigma-70 [Deltaproteobacteria bacterium]